MLEFELPRNAKQEEAQRRSGYDKIQWQRFYSITTVEINALLADNPEISWPTVPGNVLADMHKRVNAQLQAEQIPEVQYDVFTWRISRAIQYRTSSNGPDRRPRPRQVQDPAKLPSKSETPTQEDTGTS